MAHAVAHAADGVTTWQALKRPGVYEANPLWGNAVKSPTKIILLKAASVSVTTWLLKKVHKTNPKAARITVWTLTSVVASVAVHNHRVAK